jgi:hypothetical protein
LHVELFLLLSIEFDGYYVINTENTICKDKIRCNSQG